MNNAGYNIIRKATCTLQIRYKLGSNSVQIRLIMPFYGNEPNLYRENIKCIEEKMRRKCRENAEKNERKEKKATFGLNNAG